MPKAIVKSVAVGYTRVSTDLQVAEGVSLDAQRNKIQAWCLANQFTLDPDDLFTDSGISGKRADNRPALQLALNRVCETKGVLVVYSLSRLARSVKDTLVIAERLDNAGADLASLSEKIDTTSAAGKMVFRMLAVLAEFERDQISERTRSSMQYKAARGESLGKVPYGNRIGPDGKTLEIDPDEQAALAMIDRMARDNTPLRRIAGQLDDRGIVPRRGQHWHHSTIAHLIKRLRATDAA